LKVYRRRIDEHEVANMRDLTSWAEGRGWVSRQGLFTGSGFTQMLERRAAAAGVYVTAHSFRRSLAMRWLQED